VLVCKLDKMYALNYGPLFTSKLWGSFGKASQEFYLSSCKISSFVISEESGFRFSSVSTHAYGMALSSHYLA
jgi:hypothetical protein